MVLNSGPICFIGQFVVFLDGLYIVLHIGWKFWFERAVEACCSWGLDAGSYG